MTAPAAIPGGTHPVSSWAPSLDPAALADVLAKIRQWKPFDGDALLADVGDVLDDVTSPEEHIEELARRLRGHLMRLVDIAVTSQAETDAGGAWLVGRVRTVCSEDVPGDHRRTVGHLRRMGWAVTNLLAWLIAHRRLKAAA